MRSCHEFFGFFKGSRRAFSPPLSKNNEKAWLRRARAEYDAHFVEPAKRFVEALAPRLERIDPMLQAIPKVNGSIMRINRDIRFSKDKTPSKDHLRPLVLERLERED